MPFFIGSLFFATIPQAPTTPSPAIAPAYGPIAAVYPRPALNLLNELIVFAY